MDAAEATMLAIRLEVAFGVTRSRCWFDISFEFSNCTASCRNIHSHLTWEYFRRPPTNSSVGTVAGLGGASDSAEGKPRHAVPSVEADDERLEPLLVSATITVDATDRDERISATTLSKESIEGDEDIFNLIVSVNSLVCCGCQCVE